ncbi:electron transport complex subunit RsxC [Brachyspira hampsonii]|uniref:electron transport complex subunit RsxC n=1 Tax=Brachyspira hampsonii TaxID=1287055 RepID=UPI001CA553EC|nr:electron transport complex subunit RsxC [Brachyspira hampsonii]MBW5393583.1 electron transport complex subunit RsxC [Brachyspira hampsonii]
MNLGRFRFGGVHPHDSKDTADIASSALSKPPKTVLISMAQHIGAPAKMLKNKGDKIEKGELIGEAGGYVSGKVQSSVTGTVASVEIAAPPLGRGANALLINVDSNADNLAYFESSDYMSMPVEEMSKRIQQAGIVGMGGATFPTHVKVDGAAKGNADTLIINGVECEPYITSDYRLMIEYTQYLFKGIEILRKIIPSVKRTIIGIENNKPKAIEEMAKMGKEYNVEVMALRLRYPQGAEKMLIEATTGRIVPVSKLPMDVGVIVVNIATLYAIYEAVAKNKPLIERLVTVSGDAIKEHKNIWLPLGTPISHVVEECGGITAEDVLILSGGPMMGAAIPNLEQCVNKGTNSLLFLNKDKLPKEVEYPCIKCGRCGNACPLKLSPTEIAHTAKAKIKDKLNDLDIATCFECGCCSYICPSKIPLVQWIRFGKDLLRR